VQARPVAVFVTQTCGDTPFPDPYTFFHAPTVVVDGQTLTDAGHPQEGLLRLALRHEALR
jgi:hypothetical protein